MIAGGAPLHHAPPIQLRAQLKLLYKPYQRLRYAVRAHHHLQLQVVSFLNNLRRTIVAVIGGY